jgi:hypothetical protein
VFAAQGLIPWRSRCSNIAKSSFNASPGCQIHTRSPRECLAIASPRRRANCAMLHIHGATHLLEHGIGLNRGCRVVLRWEVPGEVGARETLCGCLRSSTREAYHPTTPSPRQLSSGHFIHFHRCASQGRNSIYRFDICCWILCSLVCTVCSITRSRSYLLLI